MAKKIRVWKLGNLEHKIWPTEEAVLKFKKLLEEAKKSNEDVFNIIWSPAIEIVETDGGGDVQDEVEILDCPYYQGKK